MGLGASAPEWKGYTDALLADTKVQTVSVEGTEEKTATAIQRHPDAKDGFLNFETDEELKVEMQTGWDLVDVAFKRYAKHYSFGYRPFEDPENDLSRRAKYQWDTYEFTGKQVYATGKGIGSLGFEEKSNIGIFAINRSEWLIAHLGNWSQSFRTVALYDTLGAQAVQYIVWHGELRAIYVEKSKLPQLFEALESCGKEKDLKLKYIIQFDYQKRYNNKHEAVEESDIAKAKEFGVELIGFTTLMEKGGSTEDTKSSASVAVEEEKKEEVTVESETDGADKDTKDSKPDTVDETPSNAGDDAVSGANDDGATKESVEQKQDEEKESKEEEKIEDGIRKPGPDDLAYIMYTSGTTGDPKGVMMSHRMFSCTVASAQRAMKRFKIYLTTDDVHVSYLPLAHSFESSIMTCCISHGAKVAFWSGNIKAIARDWTEIRPTIMFGVPRIYNKTYDKVKAKVAAAGGMKQYMFNKAEAASQVAIRKQQRHAMYDKLVWETVCKEIGFDRVKILASGAAPLPPFVAEFLRIICPKAVVAQGYGLTETCAISFFTSFDDPNLGHIGIPVDNIEYRLIDAPECDYLVSDKPHPRGEIQLRGPTIMDGYYKNEEATKKALSEEGWFSTGDIGRLNPNGTLSIIDRRKNMFKTAMGEYIAAEKVENVYTKAEAVNQIWIYGNSYKSFVVAVVVPNTLWLVPQLKAKGIWKEEGLHPATAPYCEKLLKVCNENKEICKELCVANIKAIEKEADLKKFERIKDYYFEFEVDLLLQGFNVENNTLTPTFKKKRPQLLKKYVDVIKEMYAANGEPAKEEEHW